MKAMKQRKKRAKKGEPQTVTKAVTHIRLEAANPGKLAALDQLAQVFLALTQQYVALFCTDELPDGFRAPCFPTPLSDRWHRVAMQQAAGIAQAWRTKRANAYQEYLDALAEYQEHQTAGTSDPAAKAPSGVSGTFPPRASPVSRPTLMSSSWKRQPRAALMAGSR